MLGDYVILCLVAAVAGAVNAIAGGGTLLTFPVLVATLGSSGSAVVVANVTSKVALAPSGIAALAGYWDEIRAERRFAALLAVPSFVGGLVGSLLLVKLPGDSFKAVVPWLILVAALLLALQPQIARWSGVASRSVGQTATGPRRHARGLLAAAVVVQLVVALYGGYFGAGIGILMLSTLAMMGMQDIHNMNAVKVLLSLIINLTALVVFVASGMVYWPYALAMAVSSSIGGYVAAHTAKRTNRRFVRMAIVAIGFALATYYFYVEFS